MINISAFQREAAFHDNWAKNTQVEDIDVKKLFESPAAVENKYILNRMGNIKGKRILDIGAGLGESSVYFAILGADVTATDISPGMVDFACRLSKYHKVKIESIVSTAEELCVEPESYDFIYAANLIHHIQNKILFFNNVKDALKQKGRFFSWDPLAYNPIINIYRKIANEVRSNDEFPLTMHDIELCKKYFSKVGIRTFWILTLSLFAKYYLVDRINPNKERYWKKIYHETYRSLWWWYPLKWADTTLTHMPGVRRMAWNVVIEAQK